MTLVIVKYLLLPAAGACVALGQYAKAAELYMRAQDPGNAATRHVHPTTGRSVVVDDVTGEVIHVGGDGFVY